MARVRGAMRIACLSKLSYINVGQVKTVKEGYYSIMDTADDVMQCTKAREVLMRYVPELVKAMDQDLIPLGLSMKSILSRDLKDDTDTMLHINDALHEIAKEY